jgi:DNA-3-methyladenine glycosylase
LPDRLGRSFFTRATENVARDLIGCSLVRSLDDETVSGRIVETEAYGDETDLASHAAVYRRSRIEIMRAEPGTIYVYRSYGVHFCFNIVAHLPGGAGAVLIRAVEPITGQAIMAARRKGNATSGLTNGPGRLAQAFAFSREDTGANVVDNDSVAVMRGSDNVAVAASARVGITRDVDRLWRFVDPQSEHLSRRHSG